MIIMYLLGALIIFIWLYNQNVSIAEAIVISLGSWGVIFLTVVFWLIIWIIILVAEIINSNFYKTLDKKYRNKNDNL